MMKTMTSGIILLAALLLGNVSFAQCGEEQVSEEPKPQPAPAPTPPMLVQWGPATLACVEETEISMLCNHEYYDTMRCYPLPDSQPMCFEVEEDVRRKSRIREMLIDLGLVGG